MTYRAELIFVLILVPFSAGILICYGLNSTELYFVWSFITTTAFLSIFIIRYLYRSVKVYHHKYIFGLLLYLLLFLLGGLHSIHFYSPGKTNYFANTSGRFLKIKVDNEPEQSHRLLRFTASVLEVSDEHKKYQSAGRLLVALQADTVKKTAISYGDIFLIPAIYTEVTSPVNPGEFDFRSWLAQKNIHHQIFLRKTQLLNLSQNKGNPVISFSLKLRQRQIAYYRKLLKDNEAFAVASTLILGYRADLSPETLAAYSRTGTIHALSVSGMHVGIIYMVIEWALSYLNRKKSWRIIKVILVLVLIWFYTLLTGCSASVLRSAIMLSVLATAKTFRMNTNSYNILAFSAFCLLLYDPFLIWDVGFQLSFLAVFGLIYLQPVINSWFFFKSTWLSRLWSMISISLAAQMTTFPLSIYYFHQFPVYFITSNLFITLPIAVLMYLGIGILLIRLDWLVIPFEALILFTNRGLTFISHLPYSSLSGIWINKTELIILSVWMILITTGLIHRRKTFFLSSFILLIGLQCCLVYDQILSKKQQRILLFQLSNNYAAAFISADTAVVVTNLATTDKAFTYSVQPALDQLNVSSLSCISLKKDTLLHGLEIRNHQLVWKKMNILVLDPSFDQLKILNRPTFDVIWLRESPALKITDLQQQVNFKILWIDGTNSHYRSKKYEDEARRLDIPIHSLRRQAPQRSTIAKKTKAVTKLVRQL